MKADQIRALALLEEVMATIAKFWILEKIPRDFGTDDLLYTAEIHTLAYVGDCPGASPSGLARQLGVTRGAVSQMIAKLEKKKLLVRRSRKGSAVAVQLFLTLSGDRACQAHKDMHARLAQRLVEYIGPVSKAQHVRLKSIVGSIDAEIDSAIASRGLP